MGGPALRDERAGVPLLGDIEGLIVAGSTGKPVGTVSRVLFHPSEPRVVGLEIRPIPYLSVIPRPLRFVDAGQVAGWGRSRVSLLTKRLPSSRSGEEAIGGDWDRTIVWRGMPVRTRSGEVIGSVGDAGFRKRSGVLTRVLITGGMAKDAAFGTREIGAEDVDGYSAGAIVVADAVAEVETSGGAVKAAEEAAGQARSVTQKAVIKTASAGMAAAKVAAETSIGRAAGKALAGLRDAAVEALGTEDEE